MSIEHAILGFLSWKPLSGYDLKKLFAGSSLFHWSGNNNQIYRSLVKLHKDELVALQVKGQDSMRPRKVYRLTNQGEQALRRWVSETPELPQTRSTFLVQLAWADQLPDAELEELLIKYEREAELQLLMAREQIRRGPLNPARTPRERFLRQMIADNRSNALLSELTWIRQIRRKLPQLSR